MGKTELDPNEMLTDECRVAFPHLFTPRPKLKNKPDGVKTYQATVLIPPDADMKPYAEAAKAVMLDRWGKAVKLRGDNNPIRDCAEKSDLAGYDEGWHYINVHSGADYPPSVVDQRGKPIRDGKKIYAGCWCRFMLAAYAWDHAEGGKGVSFSLEAVQFARDDEPFSRARNDAAYAEVFGTIEVSDDEYASDEGGGDDDAIDIFE